LEIFRVLPNHGRNVLQLRKLVTIVICEHALGAHQLVAGATEVLNLLLLVLEAKHAIHVRLLRAARRRSVRDVLTLDTHQLKSIVKILIALPKLLFLAQLHDFEYFLVGCDLVDGGPLATDGAHLGGALFVDL
jgi:hypothetical protein